MEPYRPLVDRVVLTIVERDGAQVEMSKIVRVEIISALLGRHQVRNEERTLFDLLSRSAASCARVLTGEDRELDLWVP